MTGTELAIALVSSGDVETMQAVFGAALGEQESVQGRFDVAGECITTLVALVNTVREVSPAFVDAVVRRFAVDVAARREV